MPNVNEQMLQSGFAAGGVKQDPVSGNEVPPGALPHEVRDDVDAKLSEGEFVLPASVVRFIGLERLMKMRDKAIEGLGRMESMGQMGNSDEAKANGEDPLGKFDEGEEDDDGFEAEIDDIIGGGESEDGEVEMAVGGAVPSGPVTTATGQNKGGSNAWMWQYNADPNTKYEYTPNVPWLNPEIEKYLRAMGYSGPTTTEMFKHVPSPDGNWENDRYEQDPNARNLELEKFLADNGLKIQGGTHQVPGASQKTTLQRLIGANNDVMAVDAHNDRYSAADRFENGVQLALAAMGAYAAAGAAGLTGAPGSAAGTTAGASTGGISSGLTTGANFVPTVQALPTGMTAGMTGGTGIVGYVPTAAEALAAAGGGAAGVGGISSGLTAPSTYVPAAQNITAADIGFGSMDAAGKYTAGLTGGTGVTGAVPSLSSPNLLDKAKEYVTNKLTDPKEIAKTVGKEVVKDVTGGGSKGSASSIPPWLIGAGLGAAAGSAIGGSGSSSSTPSSKTEVPRGNNPVVDYRPIDSQTEELFINNRPTGKKKKRGFAVGGDVGSEINLDAYNFFNQKD